MAPALQLVPPSNDRKNEVPSSEGNETYWLPSGPTATDGSPAPFFSLTLTMDAPIALGFASTGTDRTSPSSNPAARNRDPNLARMFSSFEPRYRSFMRRSAYRVAQ